jgi:hypothetical protein
MAYRIGNAVYGLVFLDPLGHGLSLAIGSCAVNIAAKDVGVYPLITFVEKYRL